MHKLVCQGTIEEKIDAMIESKKELAQHQELPAFLHRVSGLPQELIRMVADLLQLHDGGEDDPAALYTLEPLVPVRFPEQGAFRHRQRISRILQESEPAS